MDKISYRKMLFIIVFLNMLLALMALALTSCQQKPHAKMDKTYGQNYIYQPDSMLYITVVYPDSAVVFGPIKTLKHVIKNQQ